MPKKNKNQIMSGLLQRGITIAREAILDEDNRTVRLSFSSEAPVERYFGVEILDHGPKSIRLDRFKSGAANMLVDHDPRDVVGVIESVEVDSKAKKAFVTVRFGKSARATEIWQDVIDGIRVSVSVSYRIHKAVLEMESSDGPDVYRVTDWEPLEASLVSIPADMTVGVGRSEGDDVKPIIVERSSNMHKCKLCKRDVDGIDSRGHCPECAEALERAMKTQPKVEPRVEPQRSAVAIVDDGPSAEDIRTAEVQRLTQIREIGDAFAHVNGINDMVRDAMKDPNKGPDHMRQAILEKIGKPGLVNSADLGLTTKERKSFSLMRAIKAAGGYEVDKAGFEMEVSRAVADELGKEPQGIFVPYDILATTPRGIKPDAQRDQSVGTDSAGGYLKETIHDAAGFIELLRNKALIMAMGARALPGLVGDYTAPKQSGGATFYWVTEGGTTTESALTFGQLSMSPKTASARVDITRKALLQTTPSIEMLVRDDLIKGLALEMDRVSINGASGNDEPVGILNTTGIGSVVGGTDGGAIDWGKVVDLETEVAVDNADVGSLGYLTNTKVRGYMKQTEKASNTGIFLWPDRRSMDGFGEVNGYRAGVTNQVPSNLTKGNSGAVCSAMIFGNFSDWLIGLWGAMDLFAEKITNADSGGLVVRVFQDMDTAARHAESFSSMEDILTT